jgi:CopG family transcriptional regulator, nickel-responsive regulator
MAKNAGVARFSVSLDRQLLRQLDRMLREKGYRNRSLAVSDMVRGQLVEHRQERGEGDAVGTVSLVYDHHKPHVQETLTEIQHRWRTAVISALHVHLDHHNCLEVLVLRGKAPELRALADRLIAARGVKHGRLTLESTGRDLPA